MYHDDVAARREAVIAAIARSPPERRTEDAPEHAALHKSDVHTRVLALPLESVFTGSFHAPSPSVTHIGTHDNMQSHGWSNLGPQFLAKYEGGSKILTAPQSCFSLQVTSVELLVGRI